MDYKVNYLQTEINEELLASLTKEERSEFLKFVDGVPYIRNLMSSTRPTIDSVAKYEDGRVIVDLEHPHILKDTDYFRPSALHYKEFGCYTNLYPNKAPNSEYRRFWEEEARRCREGYVRESDGEWIPGYFYYYLNYSPIMKVEEVTGRMAHRTHDFPDFYDGDYFYFHYIDRARTLGMHGSVLKRRGVGASFKGGAMLGRNTALGELPFTIKKRNSTTSFAIANEKEYLTKDGILNKYIDNLDWVSDTTPWPRMRIKNSLNEMHWKSGYIDRETGVERGSGNEVMGVTLKNDPQKARGKRGQLILWEESGKFSGLLTAWNIARESIEEAKFTFGTMLNFGCLTAGNKVWNNDGDLVNIEDLDISKGIIGYNGKGYSNEDITYWQPPAYKECIKITTNTHRTLECSLDHPILFSTQKYGSKPRINGKRPFIKKTKFIEAQRLKIGDQVATIDSVDIWSNKKMWNPYFVGLLVGDGSYGIDKTPILSSADEETFQYIKSNFDYAVEKQCNTKDNRIYREVRIKGICKELRNLGIYGQTKGDKTLPQDIHSYSKQDVCDFLSGLFDADGYYKTKGTRSIILTSGYKNLLLEVMLLLQKLGIHSNIHEISIKNSKNPKDKNNYFRLVISAKHSVDRFYECVTPKLTYKRESLEIIHNYYKNHRSQESKNITGLRFERVVKIEYTGSKRIYNLTAGNTNTYIGNGIVTHNTGGTQGADFTALEEMFYNPLGYNIYSLRNIYDLNVEEDSRCSFFWGAYLNRKGYYDKDGNSDVVGALLEVIKDRIYVKNNSNDPNAVTQRKSENPIIPQEAILRVGQSIFPVSDVRERIAHIRTDLNKFVGSHYTGEINLTVSGEVAWRNRDVYPIREFPPQDPLNKQGAIELFQMPIRNSEGKVPPGRYIAGIDTYDDDHSSTNSLGSIFIYDIFTDRIVAEYTGRPRRAEDFYEICRRMLLLYNATANYENDKKGLYGHFYNKGSLNLLCDNLEILEEKNMANIRHNYGNKKKGTNSGAAINAWGRILQADWLLEDAWGTGGTTDEGDVIPTIPNVHMTRSLAYLEEISKWNVDGNFDRVSAMGMLLIYREDLKRFNEREYKSAVKTITDDSFFSRHLKSSTTNIPKPFYSLD